MSNGSRLKSYNEKKHGYAKTCPCSRHAAMIANDLQSKKGIAKVLRDAGYDPQHMGESIEAAIASLWEARQYLEWEKLPATKKFKYNGHWVPIAPPESLS